MQLKLKQGRPHVLLDMRVVGEGGQELPWDGKSFGDLQVGRWLLVVGCHCAGWGWLLLLCWWCALALLLPMMLTSLVQGCQGPGGQLAACTSLHVTPAGPPAALLSAGAGTHHAQPLLQGRGSCHR